MAKEKLENSEVDFVYLDVVVQGLAGRILDFLGSLFGKTTAFGQHTKARRAIQVFLSAEQCAALDKTLKEQAGVTGAADSSGSVIAQQLITTAMSLGTVTYTITPAFNGCAGTPLVVVVTVNPGIPLPPSNFVGVVAKNKFLTQTDLINILTWTPSIDPTVTSYRVYQNGVLIETVAASGPYEVVLHNRQSGQTYTYEITAVNPSGESPPLVVALP